MRYKNKGGQKSLHLNGVTANNLVVNDANGDAFGTIHLKSKNSKAINFVRKFDKSNVVVEGNEQTLNFAAGTVINELTQKAGATITAAEGVEIAKSNIDPAEKGEIITLSGDLKDTVIVKKDANAENTVVVEIKVDPSDKEEVKIENNGTINKSDESIVIDGNPVTSGVPPVTPPVIPPGGSGGGEQTPEPEKAELTSVIAHVGSKEISMDKTTKVIDLSKQANESMLTEVEITSTNATKFVLNSVKLSESDWNLVGSTPKEYLLNSDGSKTITTEKLLGIYDKGNGGISLGNLRAAGKQVVIKGYLKGTAGYQDNENIITINLADEGEVIPTAFTNEYGTITNNGKDGKIQKATVEINKAKYDLKISNIDKSAGGVDLIKPYIGNDAQIKLFTNVLLVKVKKQSIEDVTLKDLAGLGEIQKDNYFIVFK